MASFPPDTNVYDSDSSRTLAEPRVSSPRGCVALRSALQAIVRRGAPRAEVQRLVQLFCAEARRSGLRAEQLLVVFKSAWHSIPEVRRRTRGSRDELLDRLISACIEEFYAPSMEAAFRVAPRAD